MNTRVLIATNLAVHRSNMGLTQAQMAERLGVKRSLLGAYEEGRATPPVDTLLKAADLVGCTLDAFVRQLVPSHPVEREERRGRPSATPGMAALGQLSPEAQQRVWAQIVTELGFPAGVGSPGSGR